MALTKKFEVSPGLVAGSAYIRINSVSIVRHEPACAAVQVFAEQRNTEQPVQTLCYGFDLDLDGPNPIKQAYLHLKSLPEFADATDC